MINYTSYSIIHSANSFYSNRNFRYIEVPWTVDKEILDITSPPQTKKYEVNGKYLVASAEQSFLQLIHDKKLDKGKYQAITPCFRDEAVLDELHQQYFMKLELIDTLDTTLNGLESMMEVALSFFRYYMKCKIVKIDENMFDICNECDIELGSYGIREHPLVGRWTYGTGVAEPRFSYARYK